jgi:mannose-6-phosphate isomerase-like protein (cupin superfamily)
MGQYLFSADKATKFNKHGIDLTIYDEHVPQANVVHVSVDKGHFQEFYDLESHYIYYIYEGNGTFVLNDEKIQAKATDLVVIPPKTRIHYFGQMKMVLTVSPAFKEENERHVRFVDESESPYGDQADTAQ